MSRFLAPGDPSIAPARRILLMVAILLRASMFVAAAPPAPQFGACLVNTSTFRSVIEVTQIRYNTSSGVISFNQTDAFVLHVSKTGAAMRVDYRSTAGSLMSAYGTLTGTTTNISNAVAGTCTSSTSTDSVFVEARDVFVALKSVTGQSSSGIASVTYHGISMLYASNLNIAAAGTPTNQFDGFTAEGYFTQPNSNEIDFVAPSSCGIVKYMNLNHTNASSGVSTSVNITFSSVGLAVEGTDSTTSCKTTSSATTPSPSSVSPTAANPMPSFPTAYSATILTTEVETGDSFTMISSFDSASRRARVTVFQPVIDFVGRATSYIWDVVGTDQTAYYYIDQALPTGGSSPVSDSVREYFWPTTEECHRAVFTTDILSGSLGGLFATTDKQIVYVGEELVRGIPSRRWQTSNGTLVIDWYWANASWDVARRGDDESDILVRVAVRGTGQSPLFTYHPFFQQGETVPRDIAGDACNNLFPQAAGFCSGDNVPNYVFYHVHDILDFSSYTDAADSVLPSACSNPTSVEVYGSVGCTTTHELSATVVVVFIILLFVVFFCGMCCQWCRMTPRMREIEEELHDAVKAMHDHQEQLERVQSGQSPRQGDSGDNEGGEASIPTAPPESVTK
ncbi:membrane-associated protein, putative [Bodo saltans]|uniref:Membrane-associated protein, putative n=1 Tax=Bodo saltans TaxID=75058 RepID=A0A0S4IXB2_BODSA|nr:membrane-associated protein, putative [Bodo saltans]|eukprot:CUG38230.1 membrane-associated protein, putative [Bodo saltans]